MYCVAIYAWLIGLNEIFANNFAIFFMIQISFLKSSRQYKNYHLNELYCKYSMIHASKLLLIWLTLSSVHLILSLHSTVIFFSKHHTSIILLLYNLTAQQNHCLYSLPVSYLPSKGNCQTHQSFTVAQV